MHKEGQIFKMDGKTIALTSISSQTPEQAEINAELICEAVNNYPALKKQLELEAQCQSLLKDENQALRDSNAELLKAAEMFLEAINRSPAALHHYGAAIELTEKAVHKAKSLNQ